MTDEIALFIDFENIRYSLINVQHREPDPQELIGLARRFGTVMVARAYADWSRQPEFFKGSLTAAMIDRVDCPAKVRERFRQAANQAPYSHSPYRQPQVAEDDELDERELTGNIALSYGSDDAVTVLRQEYSISVTSEDGTEEEYPQEELDQPDERPQRQESSYPAQQPYYPSAQTTITQSTVDLNMLMDIIETVFDRPTISTFILMSGDRDFTRICARLKLRLNKRVIVVGVPGTVSRDLISAAEQFIPLGYTGSGPLQSASYHSGGLTGPFVPAQGPVDPEEPGFIQFLDYIDRHWSWRTVPGVANFIGDPFNPKNRFRGRLTRDSARELLRLCIDVGILHVALDPTGGENLRLNRSHPAVETALNEAAQMR